MAYADLATIQTIATGEVFTAATLQQARDNEEFLIDPPACSVYNSASVNQASGTTLTVLSANSENYDNDSMHSTSSNTSRITIQTAGRYEVGMVVSWAASGTGNRAHAFLVNGTDAFVVDLRSGTSTNSTSISGSRTLILEEGDYVEVEVFQTSGSTLAATLVEFYAVFRTR